MDFKSAALTLILVMDPLGNIPVFLGVLKDYTSRNQVKIILRESVFAFFILIAFLFAGNHLLKLMHISTEALSIGGGIILFLIALRMIFPPESRGKVDDVEPFIVPLAIPLTAGPSALATVLLFATRDPHHMADWFLAVVIACSVFTAVMLCSPFLMRLLGKRGLIAIERLMGMVLTTISVQMFLEGVTQFLQHQ